MEHAAKENNLMTDAKEQRSFFGKKNQFFFSPAFMQPKLSIGPVDDPYEREADAIADKVMRMSDTETLQTKPSPVNIQRKCAACEEEEKLQRKCHHCEEEEKLQMKGESGAVGGVTVPSTVHKVINSGGQPLDAGTRDFMESRFSYDFGNVQIHNDSLAHQSSKDINALAYTHGNHVVFGAGQYRSNMNSGKQLLAHELAHVMQQDENNSKSAIQRKTKVKDGCPLDEKILEDMLIRPLPWGIQSSDSEKTIEKKREDMRKNHDFWTLVTKCLYENISLFSLEATKISMQAVVDGVDSGQPFLMTQEVDDSGRKFEATANPINLPGSKNLHTTLDYTITGPDASKGGLANMPGLKTPQCGDTCSPSERMLTMEQFYDYKTPVRSCCSLDECDKIHEKIGLAETRMKLAIERMEKGFVMNEAIERHFNKSDTSTYLDVQEGLKRILPSMNFSQHLWICRQFGVDAESGMSVDKKDNVGGRAEKWRIAMYFNNGDIPWEDVLHEISHTAYAMGRESYFGSPGYPTDQALENADSYAQFVKEVGDPDWIEDHPMAFDVNGQAGVSIRNGSAVQPVLGLRFDWTPLGPGMRIADLVVGGSIFWTPGTGLFKPADKTIENDVFLAPSLGLRIKPKPSLYFDTDVLVLYDVKKAEPVFGGEVSVNWKPGGGSSGLTLGLDLTAIYNNLEAKPDQIILGLSVGYNPERKPHRRPPTNP